VVAVLLGITAYNSSLWMGLGLGVSIATLGLVTLSKNPLVWKVLVWLTDGIMVGILIYVFILLLLRFFTKASYQLVIIIIISLKPYEIKYMLFAEYTY
jgi:hypothetical protein